MADLPYSVRFSSSRHKEESTIRVLVTGATGFIGSHLTLELKSQGHDVHIFERGDHMPTVVKAKPEVTYHLASLFLGKYL